MKKFKFQVKDSFFPQVFNGEVEANSQEEAEQIIKEEYAYELDTTEDDIIVTFIDW